MHPFRFSLFILEIVRLFKMSYELVVTSRGENVHLIRLGTYADGVYELVAFKVGKYSPHIHDHVSSTIHVLRGRGVAIIDGERRSYSAGDMFPVPAGVPHGFEVFAWTWLFTKLSAPIKDINGEFDFHYADEASTH